ncbi:MAG TPA: carbamoyltransferase HypF, partial [Desulfuromonadales bacterium]|nr:carbamoyltransferase HypF [Desulfuromonadales bacterium]
DRPKTTMAEFAMCPECQAEYEDPSSRRFHAQPNACPACGPQLQLLDGKGLAQKVADPLAAATELLRQGRILAVKGLGGYHLAVDACNDAAVTELRRRKLRDEKPFALMSFNPERVRQFARLGSAEESLVASGEHPIVLLEKLENHQISAAVAPNNRYFGVMLPYTPLHFLLLKDSFTALVMTSGNLSDEPIAFIDREACERLTGIADYYLLHNRKIHVRTDDSIARIMAGRPVLLRRSRGYAPGSLRLPVAGPEVLALGGELKSTFCLTRGDRAYLSQHIGDLKNLEVYEAFDQAIAHLKAILDWQPQVIAHDLHPDYFSTRYAEEQGGLPTVAVQHHHAHLASCMAEHGMTEPCIGMIFDGVGYGEDGHIRGGEFLLGDFQGYRRLGHFAELPMPGGDAASREPWRMAVSALHYCYGRDLPDLPLLAGIQPQDLELLLQIIEKGINSPPASSCGRLFDAVAALVGLRSVNTYEGQAALELEMAIEQGVEFGNYPIDLISENEELIFDPAGTLKALVDDVRKGVPKGRISGRFHATLATMMVEVCERLRDRWNCNRVVLSGGVFQNRFLTELVVSLMRRREFAVLTHSLVPPNDGGLALGQAMIAARKQP